MRCTKCVLPDTTPNIVFDEDGVCNYCHTYKKVQYEGEEKLKSRLNELKQKNNKYDCIIGLSGGRDSSYALLKLVKDYNMHVLAVNYENPFTDPQAKKNIDNAVKKLGVDLISFKSKNNTHEKTFKHNFSVWLQKPLPATIPMMCISCKVVFYEIIKYAKMHKIKCIVVGHNPYEDTSFKKELINVSRDQDHKSTFAKILYGVLINTAKTPAYYHPKCLPTMIKGYLYGDPHALGPQLFASDIDFIDLFYYIPWNEQEVLSRIKNEIDWDYPQKLHSSWRFDCKLSHLKDLMYLNSLNMTEKDDLYSIMVREMAISREEALKRLSVENTIYIDEIKEVLNQVGLDEKYVLERLNNECL